MTLLVDLPRLNITRLHKLSDQVLKGDAFRTLSGLLSWWLARVIRAGAAGDLEGLHEIVPGEHELARRLLAAANPAVWAEVWDRINTLARRADAVNLDRKRTLMLMLLAIEQTAGAMPSAA